MRPAALLLAVGIQALAGSTLVILALGQRLPDQPPQRPAGAEVRR